MLPAIPAIPTSGYLAWCYHSQAGYKPAETKYSGQSGSQDDPDR